MKDGEKHRQRERERYKENREAVLAARRERYRSDPEWASRVLAENKEWHRRNPGKHLNRCRKWRDDNRDKVNASARAYRVNVEMVTPQIRMAKALRTRLLMALRKRYRTGSAVDLLGCSMEEAVAHIERQFLPGMSWGNHTRHGWHIDHIVPLSSFDLTDPAQLAQACHYTNLRPLWAKDNLSKGAKC